MAASASGPLIDVQGTSSLPRDAGGQKSKEETVSCIPNHSSLELPATGHRPPAHAPRMRPTMLDRPVFCLF